LEDWEKSRRGQPGIFHGLAPIGRWLAGLLACIGTTRRTDGLLAREGVEVAAPGRFPIRWEPDPWLAIPTRVQRQISTVTIDLAVCVPSYMDRQSRVYVTIESKEGDLT